MNSHSKRQAGRTGPWLQALMALILGAMLLAAGPARAATETITYIHGDISGSPLAATSSTGAVVWKESYRAYGERWVNDPGSAQQSQWFHGKEQDAATGLQYFGARYYDPAVGRFLGIDPVDYQDGNLHSFNRYAYGNNNPVRYADPDGNQSYEQRTMILADNQGNIGPRTVNMVPGFQPPTETGALAVNALSLAAGAPGLKSLVSLGVGVLRGDATAGMTTLYRAVGPAELASINKTGVLQIFLVLRVNILRPRQLRRQLMQNRLSRHLGMLRTPQLELKCQKIL